MSQGITLMGLIFIYWLGSHLLVFWDLKWLILLKLWMILPLASKDCGNGMFSVYLSCSQGVGHHGIALIATIQPSSPSKASWIGPERTRSGRTGPNPTLSSSLALSLLPFLVPFHHGIGQRGPPVRKLSCLGLFFNHQMCFSPHDQLVDIFSITLLSQKKSKK